MSTALKSNGTLQMRPDSLRDDWIARIFERLGGLYGAKFTDMWKDTDPANVSRTWAERLAGFHDMPEAIKAALDGCDDRPWPPTLPEFIQLCRDAAKRNREPDFNANPEVDWNMPMYKKAAEAVKKNDAYDYLAWARKLKERHESGEVLLHCQISLASGALGETWAPHPSKRNPKPRAYKADDDGLVTF